jgi:ribosomal protein S18 acetylase RimI-like enzyme
MTPEEAIAARAQAAAPKVATMRDLPVVAATLADAFSTDPVVRWWMREDSGFPAALARVHTFLASEDIPKGHVFFTPDGRAAAQWQPPRNPESPPEPPMSFWQQIMLFPRLVQNSGIRKAGRILKLIGMMDAHHPKEPHFYLFMLGVRQDSQGAGLGSTLLAACLERVDAAGMPAYLENSNPKNTRLYERHGFVARGEGRAAPNAPPLVFMWRDKRGG